MSLTVIIVLIVVGLLFLVLEILVVPGTTVVGIVGFLLMGVGIWQTYAMYGTPAGHYVLGGSTVVTIVVLALSLRSKTWNKVMLHSTLDGKVNVIDETQLKPGDSGIAVSRLAPMGKAFINKQYFEVSTLGEFIDQETEIEVISVEHKKIFVKLK